MYSLLLLRHTDASAEEQTAQEPRLRFPCNVLNVVTGRMLFTTKSYIKQHMFNLQFLHKTSLLYENVRFLRIATQV